MFYFPSFILTFPDLVEHCFPVAYFPGLMPDEVILIVLALYSRRAQTMENTHSGMPGTFAVLGTEEIAMKGTDLPVLNICHSVVDLVAQ